MKFQATFSKEWEETGFMEIEADSEDEAREIAEQLLSEDDDAIAWEMSPTGKQEVDTVEEIEE